MMIDGCPIECGLGIFELIDTPVDRHIRLADLGIKKNAEPEGGVNMDGLIHRVVEQVVGV